jgi:hypothetical protein
MRNAVLLPDNHRRSLSVAAQFVERTLDEMEELLRSPGKLKLTSSVQPVYSAGDRDRLLAAIQRMREANTEMVRDLGLESSQFREDRVITSKQAHLWTILVDSKAAGLKGFGQLTSEQAQAVDDHVDTLLSLLNEIS